MSIYSIIQSQVNIPTMLKMDALTFSKQHSKYIREGCKMVYFIIVTIYTGFGIEKATENCIECLHFLLFHQT